MCSNNGNSIPKNLLEVAQPNPNCNPIPESWNNSLWWKSDELTINNTLTSLNSPMGSPTSTCCNFACFARVACARDCKPPS